MHVVDFTQEAVVLWARGTDGGVQEVGRATLDAADFSKQIDSLRVQALVQDPSRQPVTLWLPETQILVRNYVLSSRGRGAALAEATRRLQTETGYGAEELTVDIAIGPSGEPSTVVATLCQTVREAQEYAQRWGFEAGSVSTRVASDQFGARGPEFSLPVSRALSTGRKLAAAAAVSVIILGGGFAGLKVYELSKPILHAITITKIPGHLPLPIADMDTRAEVARSSAPVRRPVTPQSLPIRRFFDEPWASVAVAGLSVHGRAFASAPFSELVRPVDDVPMKIGAEPKAADHVRPGRLATVVAGDTRVAVFNVKLAIDQIRLNSRALAATGASRTGPKVLQASVTATSPSREPVSSDVVTANRHIVQQPETDQPKLRRRAAANLVESNATAVNASLLPLAKTVEARAEPEQEVVAAVDPSAVSVPAPRPPTASPRQDASDLPAAPSAVVETEPQPTPRQGTASLVEIAPREAEPVQPDPDERLAALTSPQPSRRPVGLNAAEPQLPKKTKSKPISTGRSPTSVGRAASESGLELNETNLIGVIEANSGRRALVRLPDGDFRKVARGDDVNGWRVNSIERAAMRLTRKGQNRTLLLVSR